MKHERKKPVGPFAFVLEVEFLDRLGEVVRSHQAKSVSALIRTALEQYDFADVMFVRPAQVQVAVRLPLEIRRNLKKVARTKHTSVGQLVRAAVEAYLPQLEAAVPPEQPTPAEEVAPIEHPAPAVATVAVVESLPTLELEPPPVKRLAPAPPAKKKPRSAPQKKRHPVVQKTSRPMVRQKGRSMTLKRRR